ncbi:MAG: LPS-assembly protein LptD, partial [Rhodobacteraceae bacterium]|nr:LPS-assembly protein LptD [Paracoccaceae bacterium]
GAKDWRVGARTTGAFNLVGNWDFGWDVTYKSDRAFLSDYNFTSVGASETSNVYLEGSSARNALRIEAFSFDLSQEDYTTTGVNDPSASFTSIGNSLQDKQALVLPVVDYDYVFADPIVDGELSLTANFTSLTRSDTDAFQATGSNIDRFRGIEGTFSRFSVRGDWRRTFVDPIGQVFTPFVYARGDMFFLSAADRNVTDLTGSSFVGRFTPAAGIEYKFPIIATFDGGNHVVSPIAQIIARPNEHGIGELPNEDAQSIVFDTTTLFDYDKFSGFDRTEGGTRANVGLSYKLQLDSGYYFSALAGRSYHLSGTNSYEKPDISGSTLNSGLETSASDYVASFYLDTQYGVKLGAQARLDDDDFALKRLQSQISATYGPVVSSFAYAFLGSQPDLGINEDRQELISSASLKLFDNWRIYGSMRYDLEGANIVQDGVGLAYDDEGFSMSMTYAEDRSRNNGEPVDRTLIFRFGLRTLGDLQYSKGLSEQ